MVCAKAQAKQQIFSVTTQRGDRGGGWTAPRDDVIYFIVTTFLHTPPFHLKAFLSFFSFSFVLFFFFFYLKHIVLKANLQVDAGERWQRAVVICNHPIYTFSKMLVPHYIKPLRRREKAQSLVQDNIPLYVS